MIILHWTISTVLFLLFWLPCYLAGFLVTWLPLMFCNRDSERLPLLFWPWDNSHGINGTLGGNNPGWVRLCNFWLTPLNPDLRNATIARIIQNKTGGERTFRNRWIWVTWRNPVSNLSLYLLGVRAREYTYSMSQWGRCVFERIKAGPYWYWGFAFKYNSDRAFYYGFGWKFNDVAEGKARFMYRISPYRNIKNLF